jgi:hypothetical protein
MIYFRCAQGSPDIGPWRSYGGACVLLRVARAVIGESSPPDSPIVPYRPTQV